VRGSVAVGIVLSDGVIVATGQGPIWLRPTGSGFDQLLSAVRVLDDGKVRLLARRALALSRVRWRVDMPGTLDLRPRPDGSVLVSGGGQPAGLIRARAADAAIDVEDISGLQPTVCNVLAFPPPAECTQIDPVDPGLTALPTGRHQHAPSGVAAA